MEVLKIKELPNGDTEVSLDLTDEERNNIKQQYGWKRLSDKRIKQWFLDILSETIERDEEIENNVHTPDESDTS